LKQNYIPFNVNISNKLHLKPLVTGIFINKIFEDDFFTRARSDFPKGYYWWSETIRLHFFIGTHAGVTFKNSEKVLEITTEMNTNELYFSSYLLDRQVSLTDIFKFSIGLKYYW